MLTDTLKALLAAAIIVALIAGIHARGVDQGKEQTWQEIYLQADISMALHADEDGRVWCEEIDR